jgi:hypothetical protein
MHEPNILAGIAVNFLVPILGIILFMFVCRRMWKIKVPSPPVISYFILFGAFGGWLVVILTGLFWVWSGMASLGVFFLVLIVPFVTAGVALSQYSQRELSKFHMSAFIASIAYTVLMVVLLVACIGFGPNGVVK